MQHDASVNNLTILEFKSEERFSGSLAQYTFLFNSRFRQARPFLEFFPDIKSKFSVNIQKHTFIQRGVTGVRSDK